MSRIKVKTKQLVFAFLALMFGAKRFQIFPTGYFFFSLATSIQMFFFSALLTIVFCQIIWGKKNTICAIKEKTMLLTLSSFYFEFKKMRSMVVQWSG